MSAPRAAVALALLLLAACAAAPPRVAHAPAPPPPPPDLAQVPDAVPRAEPRGRLGNQPFYVVQGRRYTVLASAEGYVERGVASWYGPNFHGARTSLGEPYDMYAMTAAHPTLPLPCYAEVTNLSNGRHVIVRINDRGPFVANRLIDLSYTAALRLDMLGHGTAFVEVRTLSSAAPPGGALIATATAAAEPEPRVQSLYVQVGAFANPANAERAAAQLRAAGLEAFGSAVSSAGQTLTRVRVGPVADVEAFDQLVQRLAALGYPAARLAQD